MTNPNDPSIELAAVSAMRADWELTKALRGGTKAMRAAGKRYLPQWPKEKEAWYKDRLNSSTLLPAYDQTVKNLTARVFAQPIQVKEGLDATIAEQLENIDLRGNALQVWAKEWFEESLSDGMGHVLVDYPRADGIKTVEQEKAAGVRPYAVFISPRQVIGWRVEYPNGHEKLMQFRYYETVEEPDGLFAVKEIKQIRVLEPGKWSTYRKNDKNEWLLHDEGVTSIDVIPLVTFYTGRMGTLQAQPPLLDLAHLNVKHWQSQSDQDNILHIARVPVLALIGADTNTKVEIGGNTAMKIPLGGDAKYVEHGGKAIEAGRDSLKDLLDEMRMTGAKLLHKEIATVKTVAQSEEDNAESKSLLQMMAEQFEDAIQQVIDLFGKWQKKEVNADVEVKGNFDADFQPLETMKFLLDMAKVGKLSNETLFKEAKRRGMLCGEIEWDDESTRLPTPVPGKTPGADAGGASPPEPTPKPKGEDK